MIDATEFSVPYLDSKYGFVQVAKHYYYPEWHQPTSMIVFIANLDTWMMLPPERQAIIVAACEDNVNYSLRTEPERLAQGLRELEAQGATVRKPPASIVDAARTAWQEVLKQDFRDSPKLREIYTTLEPYL